MLPIYLANIWLFWQGINCYLIKMTACILANFAYFYMLFVTIVTDGGVVYFRCTRPP